MATRIIRRRQLSRIFPPDRGWVNSITENVEILSGIRGVKITLPVLTTLTFSSPPTQTEVQNLYAYVNRVRQAVDEIIKRLDGA